MDLFVEVQEYMVFFPLDVSSYPWQRIKKISSTESNSLVIWGILFYIPPRSSGSILTHVAEAFLFYLWAKESTQYLFFLEIENA